MEVDMPAPNPHPLFDHENFNFKELRQRIIHYAIHDNKGEVSKQDVANCRLVCSDWCQITTQVLRQSREPLFHLRLDQMYSLKGKGYYNKWTKKLELNLMGTCKATAPPIDLFVEEEDYPVTTIGRQLNTFGNNLVSLTVAVTPQSSRLLFPEHLTLPLLQSLSISVRFTDDPPDAEETPILSLQSIFKSCPELKVLKFPVGFDEHNGYDNVVLPADFHRVLLPETLTTLEFPKLEAQHFEVLARSNLPKLKELELIMPRNPLPDGLFTRVLENVKSSLEQLTVSGDDHEGDPGPRTNFRFPLMEKLDYLHLTSVHLELESGIQSLETFLPKLTRIWILDQTPEMLSKWTQSESRFPSVTYLYVSMCDPNFPGIDSRFHVNLNEAVTREIAYTFPNVKTLFMCFEHRDYSALNTVWQQMTQVEMLTLYLAPPKYNICQDHLTSGLLGIAQKKATYLRTKRTKSLQLGSVSIKQMSNLKSLLFVEVGSGHFMQHKYKKEMRMVSDSVFEMALLKMPQLTEIVLTPQFWASEEMITRWKASGRIIYPDEFSLI